MKTFQLFKFSCSSSVKCSSSALKKLHSYFLANDSQCVIDIKELHIMLKIIILQMQVY